MTIFLTIFTGVIVFVLGQTILKLFVEPWQQQRECIAKISNAMVMYANSYLTPGVLSNDEILRISKETRSLAAELAASYNRIPFYITLQKSSIFPSLENIRTVQSNLIGLSNGLGNNANPDKNERRINEIKKLLEIE